MIILGVIILAIIWFGMVFCLDKQCTEIAKEADEERAQEIADEIIANSEYHINQRITWEGWER